MSAAWAIIVFLVTVVHSQAPNWNQTIYGNIPPTDYLIGKFDPEVNSQFATVSSFGLTWQNSYIGYLRDDVGNALYTMVSAFNQEYPQVFAFFAFL